MRCHLPDADALNAANGPTAACVNGIARTMPLAENGISLSNCSGIRSLGKPATTNLLIFGTEKISRFVVAGFPRLRIPEQLDKLIPFSANGMVLAIPLTQAAVGPFAAFNASASGR